MHNENKANGVHIRCYHLLNDFSGSPRVLSLVVEGLIEKGYSVEIITSRGGKGFLSEIKDVSYSFVNYKISKNKLLWGLSLFYAQFQFFISSLARKRKEKEIIYINTILPFGAAIGAWLLNKRIIYHVHEFPAQGNMLHKFAAFVFKRTSTKAIFVSKYLLDKYAIPSSKKKLVYNALPASFVANSKDFKPEFSNPFVVLMLCSIRKYKGVDVFVRLAKELKDLEFTLVLNGTVEEVEAYFGDISAINNLKIVVSPSNVQKFYLEANLVLNLSLPDLWIETFGLTAIEAMCYGIPVVVPPVGGIAEITEQGKEGYQVDSRDYSLLEKTIIEISSSKSLYDQLSDNAKIKSKDFYPDKMINLIEEIIN